LLEVNSSPGLEGIEAATGKDLAGKMIQKLEQKLRWVRPLSQEAAAETSAASR
jgi:ribosomal protein S6--L-glutamate ligase